MATQDIIEIRRAALVIAGVMAICPGIGWIIGLFTAAAIMAGVV